MDREEPKRFDWLPRHMPGVARMVREKRQLYGDAHVNECWKRGVVDGEPGWFFAREGALAVGVPATGWTLPQWMEAYLPGTTMVWFRVPEVRHGAD